MVYKNVDEKSRINKYRVPISKEEVKRRAKEYTKLKKAKEGLLSIKSQSVRSLDNLAEGEDEV